jgi:hypothetical protein
MCDPFETGTPKYSTANDIYEGLCALTHTEEMGILSQMFPDVSYEGQEYYYTDKGSELKEKFEEMYEYGEKMWLMDLAMWQIDQSEMHDFVYTALINSDLAKRINFKKLFVEYMLSGDKSDYDEITEEYLGELGELNRFDNWEMIKAWNRVMEARGKTLYVTPYPTFCYHLRERMSGLKLDKECQLIIECRSLLTSYDDFMIGLKMNQALYETQEKSYQHKVAALQEGFDQKLKLLMLAAERAGLIPEFVAEMKQLSGDGVKLVLSGMH